MTLEEVIRNCDCWSERALRASPESAVKPQNHDLLCPVRYGTDQEKST